KNDASKRLRSNATYHPTETWIANAQRESTQFRAAICSGLTTLDANLPPNLASAEEIVTPNNQLWVASREVRFTAGLAETMGVLLPLVRNEKRVVVIEPFFSPNRDSHRTIALQIIEALRHSSRV